MPQRLRYLLLLLFFGRLAVAQTYEPGLLVRSNGDTLRGEIENNFWVEPPAFIHFRQAAAGPVELLQPRQLRAVRFAGGRYFSYRALALDHAANIQDSQLSRGYAPRVQVDSVLAEVLLAGPVSLLRVVLQDNPHYVLQRPGKLPIELVGRHYLRQSAGGDWHIVDGNNYRDQLRLYFIDCPAAAHVAEGITFTAAGLVAVAQAYATACTESRQPAQSWLSQARPKRHSAFQGGVLVGVRYNRLEGLYTTRYGTGACTDCRPHPFGGLYAELLQPSRTTALYGELSLSTFHNQGVDVFQTLVNYDYVYTYKPFEYAGLLATARLGIRYLPPLPHSQQLIVGLGFEYNKPLGQLLPPPVAGADSRQPANEQEELYAVTTLLPNLTVGWRRQRLSLLLDGQLYLSSGGDFSVLRFFFGSNFALRLGASYRLGRNPDVPRPAGGK